VPALALADQTAGDQLGVVEALLPEVLEQVLAATRGEADTELLGGVLVEAAAGQELAGLLRVGRGQLLGVVGLRDLVRLEHPRPQVRLALHGASVGALLVAQLHAVLVGQPLDRLGERQAVDLHQEGDHVAAFLAAETVKKSAARVDVEGRGLLVVEGAQALLGAAAGVLEGDVAGDHLFDPGSLPHECDVVVPDQSCHGRESTSGRSPVGGGVAPVVDRHRGRFEAEAVTWEQVNGAGRASPRRRRP
jgi:hypothetical protein